MLKLAEANGNFIPDKEKVGGGTVATIMGNLPMIRFKLLMANGLIQSGPFLPILD